MNTKIAFLKSPALTHSAAVLMAALIVMPFGAAWAAQKAKTTRTAKPAKPVSIYNQGYTKGYGEGYAQGQRDWSNSSPRDFQRSEAYRNREQSLDPTLATLEEYRQGFDLGFDLGYTDAYYGRAKTPAVPANAALLAKAAALADAQRAEAERAREQRGPDNAGRSDRGDRRDQGDRDRGGRRPRNAGSISVPDATEFKIRLTSRIDTKKNVAGDRFSAVVISPSSFENAKVEGHIATLTRSGKVSGKTELGLAFDTITIEDGRTAPFHGDLQRIYDSENVKKIDEEGRVETGSKTTDTQKRGAIGAVAGAVIGGIAGGGKGALIGAVVGGAAGVGTVLIDDNKDLLLEPGTEMLVKTESSRR